MQSGGLKQSEYDRLCQEMLSQAERRTSAYMTMYTVTVALIGIGWQLQNEVLFMLAFVLIIFIQLQINGHLDAIFKIGEYIKVFYEIEEHGIAWERNLAKIDQQTESKNIAHILSRLGSSFMGIISLASFLYFWAKNPYHNYVTLIAALLLFIVVIAVNSRVFKSSKTRAAYQQLYENLK